MIFDFYKRKKISLSYGITVCNEYKELNTLLEILIKNIDPNDEIIVLQDITQPDELTTAAISNYKNHIIHIEAKLNEDFATFKNLLIEKASRDYLFQIDADEVPRPSLFKKIKRKLYKKRDCDCFLVPRINKVNGLTDAHIEKWKWNIDKHGRINYPDYQFRILRLNGIIKWKNKVHEELDGFKKIFYLPRKKEDYCLMHIKSIEKQEKQNDFYDTIPVENNLTLNPNI